MHAFVAENEARAAAMVRARSKVQDMLEELALDRTSRAPGGDHRGIGGTGRRRLRPSRGIGSLSRRTPASARQELTIHAIAIGSRHATPPPPVPLHRHSIPHPCATGRKRPKLVSMSSSDLREGRPSPDALLAEAQREARGRLKIFLGAAPGVGKTYEMLSAAQARKRDGIDVVVGVVETHGRKETEALLTGLEVIARRQVEYRGRELEEMDLDALLARHPQLALIDELAHTNAPGSRHPKRYMDVEELLAAGIDVYATLNIQHVESLNDVVARITRIRVRETVPDSVIDKRRRHRADRPHAGRPHPAPEGRQGLRPAPGRTCHPPLLRPGQPHRPARTRAAPHRAAGGRADGAATCRRTRSRGRGRPASACWSASAATPTASPWCDTRAGSPTG